MLPKDDNTLITQTGPGTPMGELFRRYWLPAMISEELPGPDCTLDMQYAHQNRGVEWSSARAGMRSGLA